MNFRPYFFIYWNNKIKALCEYSWKREKIEHTQQLNEESETSGWDAIHIVGKGIMPPKVKELRKGLKAVQDLELLKVLKSEIEYELTSNTFKVLSLVLSLLIFFYYYY